jgi:hypothetical protein
MTGDVFENPQTLFEIVQSGQNWKEIKQILK